MKIIPVIRKITKSAFSNIYINKNSTLAEERYKKIALGAIYSEQQTTYINSLETGSSKSDLKTILGQWWGINSRNDAIEILNDLTHKGYRFYFKTVFAAYQEQDTNKVKELLQNNFNNQVDLEKSIDLLNNLKDTYNDLKSDGIISHESDIEHYGIVGWDCGRLVYVARLCYDAGYITEDEAWQYIDSADALAHKTFHSWHDYGYSYVLGRAMWGGSSANNSGVASIAKTLLEKQNSPWVEMDW